MKKCAITRKKIACMNKIMLTQSKSTRPGQEERTERRKKERRKRRERRELSKRKNKATAVSRDKRLTKLREKVQGFHKATIITWHHRG